LEEIEEKERTIKKKNHWDAVKNAKRLLPSYTREKKTAINERWRKLGILT